MNQKNIFIKGLITGALAAATVLIPLSGLGALPKLNAIKPAANQTAALSDEQQGILAVRSVKAAVVSILGSPTTSPNSLTITQAEIAGSGFIISSDGLIVTNNHVVQDPNLTYTVTLLDGHEFPAKVLGLDKYDDVAMLKIDATGLATVKFGNSDNLETGQTVFAIGNALGKYQNTVTKGVVSGLGRALSEEDINNATPRLQNLIQTDAAINPGNSGGPLIDLAGEVVGMNTLIDISGSNLGFAVSSSVIQSVVNQLQTFGKVSKTYLGITFTTIDNAIKTQYGLSVSQGALVASVVPGGPADQAGVLPGDIILSINHDQLTQTNEIDKEISKFIAGSQVLVTLLRNGQQMDVPLILGQMQ